MSKGEVKDPKLFESSKLKLAALTKSGADCQDALAKLKPVVPHLAKNDPKFVEFMFAPLWEKKFFEKRGEKIFVAYAELLAKLISIDKSLHERTVRFFISLFLGDKSDDLKENDQLTKTEQRLFPKMHYFLCACSKPMIVQSTQLILNSFPFTTVCSVHGFVCYFSNCSSIYRYAPDEESRKEVLWRLIERLIHIDSYLQNKKKSDKPTDEAKLNRLFEVGLSSMFKFINKICLRSNLDLSELTTLNDLRSACDQEALRELFDSFASIFIGQLIKMDSATSINLVILYVCALNEQLCTEFLEALWCEASKMPNPKPAVVNYLCSFLCAAKFLSLDTLVDYMLRISERITGYLKNISIEDDLENFHKTLKKHKHFYAMVNGLFQLVCVRSQEFTDRHVRQLSQLQVQKIITCSLNPLAVCPIEIVKQFADICKYYNLGLCNMVLQRNRRTGLYDLLKKREVRFRLVYPFNNLTHLNSYDKLLLVYSN